MSHKKLYKKHKKDFAFFTYMAGPIVGHDLLGLIMAVRAEESFPIHINKSNVRKKYRGKEYTYIHVNLKDLVPKNRTIVRIKTIEELQKDPKVSLNFERNRLVSISHEDCDIEIKDKLRRMFGAMVPLYLTDKGPSVIEQRFGQISKHLVAPWMYEVIREGKC